MPRFWEKEPRPVPIIGESTNILSAVCQIWYLGDEISEALSWIEPILSEVTVRKDVKPSAERLIKNNIRIAEKIVAFLLLLFHRHQSVILALLKIKYKWVVSDVRSIFLGYSYEFNPWIPAEL